MIYRDSMNLVEEWRVFLQQNPDAWLIVNDAMKRTGFAQDEVLFVLIEAWAAQNLTSEQRREFDQWVCPSTSMN
jgi:hypothetical protein